MYRFYRLVIPSSSTSTLCSSISSFSFLFRHDCVQTSSCAKPTWRVPETCHTCPSQATVTTHTGPEHPFVYCFGACHSSYTRVISMVCVIPSACVISLVRLFAAHVTSSVRAELSREYLHLHAVTARLRACMSPALTLPQYDETNGRIKVKIKKKQNRKNTKENCNT